MNLAWIILEPTCEVKVVKFSLIGLIIASVTGLIIWEISFNPDSEIKTSTDSTEVKSGFGVIRIYEQESQNTFSNIKEGLTYVDNSLGFEISRPNEKWEFDTNIDDMLDSQSSSNKKFLGGMYVKNDNGKPIFIGVFDLTQFENFDLDAYIQSQKDVIDKFDSNITINEISPQNNWSVFGAEITLKNKTRTYGEQILEIHNDKLYMLQYSGDPPYLMLSQTRDEIRDIMDSFIPFG